MSTLTLAKLGTAPSPPGAGDLTLYAGSDGSFYAEDELGVVTKIGGGGVAKTIRNESGVTIPKGRAVYVSGYSLTEELNLADLADKDDPARRPAIGVTQDDIPNNSNGEVAVISVVRGIDTSAFALSDQLVLGNNGALIRPPPGNSPFTGEVQNLAVVTRVHVTEGEIAVILDGLNPVTADQIFALVGTNGSPGPTNKFVTDSDPRLSAIAFDPRDLLINDHFLTGNVDSDEIGSAGWRVLAAGTGNSQSILGEVGHPGIARINPGSTAAGRVAIYMGGEATLNPFALGAGQNQISQEWLIRVDTAALSGLNNERITVGFGDEFDAAAGVEHANGVYVEINPGVLGANFRFVTAAGGVRGNTDTTIAVAADTWYRLEIVITYPGDTPTATLFINGVQRAQRTANFPTAQLGLGFRTDAVGVPGGFNLDVDYCVCRQVTAKET